MSKIYTLNPLGQEELSKKIAAIANGQRTLNPEAWFEDAENQACDFDGGYSATIEVCQFKTGSGRPEVIDLEPEWFDVQEIED